MASAQLNSNGGRFGKPLLVQATEGMTDQQLLERFVAWHDEAAFEALVQRHGPMVLGVCQRLLHDPHDADDAFQATFLILVRKAGLIGKPELLGNWLYGVAYRVALKARANAVRRSICERRAASMPKPEPASETTNRELRSVLDEEINNLPEKYRAPLVLCYLEGKTNEQAARLIGCPAGSMSWRLSRGREMLRKRLRRRGMALASVVFLPWLTQNVSAATVSAKLLGSTVRAAVSVAVGKGTAGAVISRSVASLAEETTLSSAARSSARAMFAAVGAVLVAIILLIINVTSFASSFQRPSGPAIKADPQDCAHPSQPDSQK